MKKLTRKEMIEVLDVMLASPENDTTGTLSIDLAEALDMFDVKHHRPTRAFYSTMRQLIEQRYVVQTQPTPYARWKAISVTH